MVWKNSQVDELLSNGAVIPSRPIAKFVHVGTDLINLSKELTSRSGISDMLYVKWRMANQMEERWMNANL